MDIKSNYTLEVRVILLVNAEDKGTAERMTRSLESRIIKICDDEKLLLVSVGTLPAQEIKKLWD